MNNIDVKLLKVGGDLNFKHVTRGMGHWRYIHHLLYIESTGNSYYL